MEIFLQDSAEVMFLIEEQHFLVIVERHEEEQEQNLQQTRHSEQHIYIKMIYII